MHIKAKFLCNTIRHIPSMNSVNDYVPTARPARVAHTPEPGSDGEIYLTWAVEEECRRSKDEKEGEKRKNGRR